MHKIIFIGTTEFGIPTLEKLKSSYELSLVITQPDKPVGRKQVLTPPPIKTWAEKNHIPVLQPKKVLDSKFQIQDSNPDLILVAAYGQIIPKEILGIPKFGSINIHGSLLPKYRGATPIQTAILNQESETGITLILMDEKMDHGPLISRKSLTLKGLETYPELYETLAKLSAELVVWTLPDWFEGKIKPNAQDHERATFTKMLTREMGRVSWSGSSKSIDAQVRALNPEPGTWTMLDGKVVKILKTTVSNDHRIELPGRIFSLMGQMAVKTYDQSLIIDLIQPESGKPMSGKDFLNGLKSGSKLFI